MLRSENSGRYPTSATCTSQLTLPNYGSAAELKRRLELAMAPSNASMYDKEADREAQRTARRNARR